MEIDITWQLRTRGGLGCSKYGWREEKGCGGLLRNSNSQWIGEFSRHLGMCSAYLAELWGVIDGLRLVYDVIVGLRLYEQCPASLSNLLLMDVMGIATPRVISV
ncbi:hypothetical protein P8452_17940 [Trifolium repens]|nr:hypothetical protein P8452_17940 [Trifolium repens]